jgi:hypothetical protein
MLAKMRLSCATGNSARWETATHGGVEEMSRERSLSGVSAVRMRGVLLPRVVLRCCFTVFFFFFFFFFPCAGREIYSYAKTNKNEKGGGPRGTPRTGPGSTLSKRYG